MTAKDNLINLYLHRNIDHMPAPGEGEQSIYPTNGFLERPANNQSGLDWLGCAWEYCETAKAPAPDVRHHLLADICSA